MMANDRSLKALKTMAAPEDVPPTSDRPAVSVIIPAYNEASVIGEIVSRVFRTLELAEHDFEVVVVDDGSEDETAHVAQAAGAYVIRHPYNVGNGAAVKSGIRKAKGTILVMMDGDGQHSPEDIPRLLEFITSYDMVVGARTRESETAPPRALANTIYNLFASYACGHRIEDLTSGFRVIRADVARGFVYLLPNTYSYPSTITMAVIRAGHSLRYVPIKAGRRTGHSKIRPLRDGIRFLMIILRIAVFFSPLRVFVPMSLLLFALGLSWYIYSVFLAGRPFPPTSIVVLLTSVIIFFMGLISEQIAQLRHERTE